MPVKKRRTLLYFCSFGNDKNTFEKLIEKKKLNNIIYYIRSFSTVFVCGSIDGWNYIRTYKVVKGKITKFAFYFFRVSKHIVPFPVPAYSIKCAEKSPFNANDINSITVRPQNSKGLHRNNTRQYAIRIYNDYNIILYCIVTYIIHSQSFHLLSLHLYDRLSCT